MRSWSVPVSASIVVSNVMTDSGVEANGFVRAHAMAAKYASASGALDRDLSATALQKLELYDWPGNVRELENVIERSVVLCPETVLGPQDIQLGQAVQIEEGDLFQARKAKVIAQFERAYLHDLLCEHHGNISRAA